MTQDEIDVLDALSHCTLPPATMVKRFVRDLLALAQPEEHAITAKQSSFLFRIATSYRAQLPDPIVDIAFRYSGGVGLRGPVRKSYKRKPSRLNR